MSNITQDINGKESSKRYWAKRFFTLGFWLALGMFVFWAVTYIFVDKDFQIPSELIDVWKWLMGFGSTVILGTLLERKK